MKKGQKVARIGFYKKEVQALFLDPKENFKKKELVFEGNMADPGEVDETAILHRVDVFMHAQGHERLQD